LSELGLPLSFSIEAMRGYVEAGARAAKGAKVAGRVKRQTMRGRKPETPHDPYWRAYRAIGAARPVRVYLWWRQRTKARRRLGDAPLSVIAPVIVEVRRAALSTRLLVRIDDAIVDKPAASAAARLAIDAPSFARADGFETVAEMIAYFFPKWPPRVRTQHRAMWLLAW